MTDLLSLADAAQRLGVHVSTLRAWVRAGRIPAYRLGQRYARVDWAEILGALSHKDSPEGHRSPNAESGASHLLQAARNLGLLADDLRERLSQESTPPRKVSP